MKTKLGVLISLLTLLNMSCVSKKLETRPSAESRMSIAVKYDFSTDGFKSCEYYITNHDSIIMISELLNLRSGISQRGTRIIKMEARLEFSIFDKDELTQFYIVYLRSDHGTFVQQYTVNDFQTLVRSEYNNEIEKFLETELNKRGIYPTPISN